MKADFPAANELEERVRRQAIKWKAWSFIKISKMADFWSKTVQQQKQRVTNESLQTIIQLITELGTINHKFNPQASTRTPPSTINAAVPTPAQEEVQEINTKSYILVDLYWKRELGQLSQNDHNDITLAEAALRKYKADLKQEEAAHKLQKKFRVNQKRKIQAIEKQTEVKLLKKLQKE